MYNNLGNEKSLEVSLYTNLVRLQNVEVFHFCTWCHNLESTQFCSILLKTCLCHFNNKARTLPSCFWAKYHKEGNCLVDFSLLLVCVGSKEETWQQVHHWCWQAEKILHEGISWYSVWSKFSCFYSFLDFSRTVVVCQSLGKLSIRRSSSFQDSGWMPVLG